MSAQLASARIASALVDARGRALGDLRLSVTDRCNFRCGYCMPRELVDARGFLARREWLDFDEMSRIARVFVGLGVRKIRLTGGEPLLRRDLAELVTRLAGLDVDLALTTNGVLLPGSARELARAGLRRVTVSLDALDDDVFQRMNDAPAYGVQDVLDGITAAEAAGFTRIKINTVVRRGVNEDQIVPLVRTLGERSHVVRFIEYMDVGTRNGWRSADVVGAAEIREKLRELGEFSPLARGYGSEVSERYRFDATGVEFGIVASVTAPFCGECARARLSVDGRLVTCLFASQGTDLREPLRRGASDDELSALVGSIWRARTDRYSEERATRAPDSRVRLPWIGEAKASTCSEKDALARIEMSTIGG